MRILILKKDATGIINLKNIEHYLIDNVENFSKIADEIYKVGKETRDYKYCEFGEGDFIPYFIRIKDGLFNQMSTFGVERVRYSELDIKDEEKETMIKKMISNKNNPLIENLENKGLKKMFRKEIGEEVDEEIIEIGDKIETLEKELSECDYKKYLEFLV